MSSSDSSFSSSFSSSFAASAAGAAPPAAGAAAPPPDPPDGTEASLAEPSVMSCEWCVSNYPVDILHKSGSYLVDVLALELGEKLLETLSVCVNTDRFEEGGDVFGAGALVATEAEEEVCCEAVELVRRV